MGENGLVALYRLHLIDEALLSMRQRAAALDGGKALLVKIRALQSEHAEQLARPGELRESAKNHELRAAEHRAKAKDLEKYLYGGKVVNAKESATLEQEIQHQRDLADQAELEALAALDALPAAEEAAKVAKREIAPLARAFEEKKAVDAKEVEDLKQRFARKQSERGPAAAEVPKPLLAQYEAIRGKYAGVGMGVVRGGRCGACGTGLPTKVLDYVSQDRVMTCETCHRILFQAVSDE